MLKVFRNTLTMLLLMTVLTGLIYPLGITLASQVVFPSASNGSVIVKDGKAVGSELIGQSFDDPKYFWGRLSATGPFPYNAAASSGSNLGPMNSALMDAVKARIKALRDADPTQQEPIPVDLVTASASGLDPDISPAAAKYQVGRVAMARGLDVAVVQELIDKHLTNRQLGFLGEPRVNVLTLNMALDALKR